MSWLRKRGQSTTPSPGYTGPPSEPVPMYNPNQVFSTENVTPFYPYTENREIVRNSSPSLAQVQQMQYIPTQTYAPQATTPLIPQEDITNPFKRASAQMQNTNNTMPSNQFVQNANPTNDYSSRQHAFSQHFSQSVNLETPPENSEQPDYMSNSAAEKPFAMQPTLPPAPKAPMQQPWVGNSETIMTERNQYLETGHLSGIAEAPPPQVRMDYMTDYLMDEILDRPRLEVVGRRALDQMERNVENCNDEPPPGLSRMVLGQNEQNENGSEDASNPGFDGNGANSSFEPINFPYGLRRMVPGESSSPENSTRQSTFQSQDINVPDSDPEFGGVPQLRSATIGADTPPTTSAPLNQVTLPSVGASDRSETIGAADEGEMPRGSSISPTNGGKKTSRKAKEQTNDYVEVGQHTESEIGSLVASVRNLTVGENSSDETNEVSVKAEPRKKVSRPESSESETEKRAKTPPRDRKDRRYKGERRDDRRERDNYSPESRARRYERRKYRDRNHDDSGDYYSDGERDKTKQDRDYDKKYYSLRKDKERDRRRKESPREYERDGRRKRDEYYHRYEDSYDNEERSSRPSSRSDSMHDSMYRGSRRSEKDSRDRRRDRPAARDRERDKHRRPRDPYNPYNMPGYGGYDPYNPYYQQYQYQYYENLRRTNPQAYAEIYRKYYEQHAARHPPGYAPEDRSSVHSGRSSVNGDMAKDRFTRQSYYSHASSVPYMADYYARDSQTNSISGHYDLDESSYSRQKDTTDSFILEDSSVKAGRTTPAKFPTAHTKVSIACGRVVKVLPNYPQDGQPALVELAGLGTYLQNDDEYKELSQYPGPLVKGVTHKKTVIEYCENKIKNVGSNSDVCGDPDSYVLMWEFLILLLRQNGKVVGTDIAELLLKNRTENLPVRPASVLSNISSTTGDVQAVSETSLPQVSEGVNFGSMSLLKEEEVTNKFREYLLYGSEQEALEWAMKHGLWGHALFLASKLGKRTHSNVMIRFANGLTMNDPLQTLYQLLSGRIPSAVSGVAEEKWGDWKPHLAMMLSNSSLQPELNRKAITAMGDTLMARGSLCAAQFCYLMAETGFGRYGADNVKMVLLGSNHNKPFPQFATNEAVHMTEIYEYACSLNDQDFMLPELQVYKYLLATRLASFGLLQKSLAFLERIALYITNNPSNVQSSLVNNVCNLADRLKYYDLVSVDDEEESAEHMADNRLDNTWLKTLKTLQDNINSGLMTYNANDMTLTDTIQSGTYGSTLDPARQNAWDQPQLYPQQYQGEVGQSPWQSDQQAQLDPSMDGYGQVDHQQLEGFTSYQDQQSYWSNQQQQQWDAGTNQQSNESLSRDQSNYYGSANTQSESGKAQNNSTEEEVRPQISMPGQSKGRSIFDEDEPLPHEKAQNDKRQQQAKAEPAKPKESSGWFGGIFSKLAPKPKNQMKLPDDKNPTIVWDEDKKRWVNVDEDNNNPSTNELKPPPKMSDIMTPSPKPQIPQANHNTTNNNSNNNAMPQGYTNPMSYSQNNNSMNVPQQPLPANNNNQQPQMVGAPNQDGLSQQSNIFKLQKSRNLKKSYIDVFNPGGVATKPAVPAPQMPGFPVANNNAPQMNFFIPQPVTDPNAPTNFLTQGNPVIQPQYDESAQKSKSKKS
ncbi:protein transport protein Sec16B isoform X2 [Harmonia axyridis]|uniref:protein transport protein Sec16B isoform X2 n=1 Tax=Harmonia axyridis TaxID=115357 RepID=UPI001E277B16|nr:protein transport protein Sec16B isoform X2 [Harmonia axyridis]XP_045460645.1 protein transport protein Sec16B isoform X2 [Harmonia axyridis]